MNILCWLWPLISGIICGILGYLLGRLLSKGSSNDSQWKAKYEALVKDLDACKNARLKLEGELESSKNSELKLEADLEECKKSKLNTTNSSNTDNTALNTKITSLESDIASKNTKINELEQELRLAKAANLNRPTSTDMGIASSFAGASTVAALIPFDADKAKSVFGKKIKQDDLKVVEGIGPKIEGLFHNFDIKTWKALSETSIEKCQEVLNSGGERYKIHNPGTWPKQAQLAYEGKWEELLKWQDELDGGKA